MFRAPGPHWLDLTATIQYSICSDGFPLNGDKLRTLADPIPAAFGIIPYQDSVPLTVLNYPTGDKHETDLAAYDPPTPAVLPFVDGPDAV